MIRRFELTGDLRIAPGEVDGQLHQKLLLLPWLRILDAMCDHQAVKIEHCLDYIYVMGALNNFVPSDSDPGPLCAGQVVQ